MAEQPRDLIPIKRALVSVSDKTDLIPFMAMLASIGVEIISTGGTAKAIAAEHIPVVDVSKVTGFPECFGGRVKTLHPLVHGPILFRRDVQDDVDTANSLGMSPIDLIVVNLYPFEETIKKPGIKPAEANEQIDIGGPTLLCGGSKNHSDVAVVSHPRLYKAVMDEIREHEGATSRHLREVLKVAAFTSVGQYYSRVGDYFARAYRVSSM